MLRPYVIECRTTQHGESALHLAAKYDHPNVVTTLAGTKMDVNMRGKVRYMANQQ